MKPQNGLATIIGMHSRKASFQRFLQASYSENTELAYGQDVKHFKRWGGKIPAVPELIAKYLAAHAGKLACATLTRRMAAMMNESGEGRY
jgi:hypothetical protein